MKQQCMEGTAPFYQQSLQSDLDRSDLASFNQVAELKKWISILLITNIISSVGIIGFLIFIYYTLLIEIQDR
uniref:Transmembrane protein n=1 Tax=Marseillevirus LCMAC101 TaxID=2506602 RepID=A0A481YQX8_9VIRU|nr:MAG: hypothetical protein LCMAC101_02580 [Marseillevirus LCMAC101]